MQQEQTIRERLWLWAMKVNILQELGSYVGEGWSDSTWRVCRLMPRSIALASS